MDTRISLTARTDPTDIVATTSKNQETVPHAGDDQISNRNSLQRGNDDSEDVDRGELERNNNELPNRKRSQLSTQDSSWCVNHGVINHPALVF